MKGGGGGKACVGRVEYVYKTVTGKPERRDHI
jgi:hypothetical protein